MGQKPPVPGSCSCSKRGRAGHTRRGPDKSPVSYEQAPGLAPHDGPPWAKLPTLGDGHFGAQELPGQLACLPPTPLGHPEVYPGGEHNQEPSSYRETSHPPN